MISREELVRQLLLLRIMPDTRDVWPCTRCLSLMMRSAR